MQTTTSSPQNLGSRPSGLRISILVVGYLVALFGALSIFSVQLYISFLLLIAGSDMLARLDLRLTSGASRLAARHWPGPLTLVLPGGERRVPERLRGPEGGVAVRWTSHTGMQNLIRAYGDPIT